jgi:hypothetical protein
VRLNHRANTPGHVVMSCVVCCQGDQRPEIRRSTPARSDKSPPPVIRAEVPIPHAGQNGWICYLRRVARVHGHVSGGKRQGLEAGWLYVEGQMGWLRATSCRAPHRAISFWRNTNLSPSISCARGDREEVCGDLDVLKQLAWVGGGHSGSCP